MVPEKKKKNTNNPLSQARGNKLSAEELWDRKTGVGFRSFVEYYTQQPVGTVSTASSTSTAAEQAGSSSRGKRQVYAVEQNNNQGRGLSRAAKRRKKKKGRLVLSGEEQQPSPSESTTEQGKDAILASRPLKVNDNVNHPLLQAVEQMTSPHSRYDDGSRREDLTPFFEAMARPLPLTFRIRSTADSTLVGVLQKKLQSLENMTAAGTSDNGIRPVFTRLDFGNDNNMQVYQASCSKAALTDPAVKALLLENSQNGVMARQELGSMLPVAALASAGFLSGESTRRCLDMCASPGSKTLQALEVLHGLGKITKAKQKPKSSAPKVLLVANDVLKSRLEALQQAVARSGVPESLTQSIVYTCQDATKFELRAVTAAAARTKKKREPTTDAAAAACRRPPLLHFDAILCDVPCSGDGTCRKDRHVLPQWKPAIGNQLHATQVAILSRAVALLEPGGCVCYSTCSLNPVENEAVVAAVLHEYNTNDDGNHQLELERWPVIPGLILRDGISHWKIAHYRSSSSSSIGNTADPLDSTTTSDPDDDYPTESDRRSDSSSKLMWYASFEGAQRSSGGGKDQVWSPSMWPPPDAAHMNLSRCKRLWPQDQDSGGFFLALIRKKQTTK